MNRVISVIILTHNEAIHIERAIKSVAGIASEVFVVDSYSSDRTVQLAAALGAHIHYHKFVNYSDQFKWALQHLEIQSNWILRLDADEVFTPELCKEVVGRLSYISDDISGIVIPLKYIVLGREMRYGGRRLELMRITRRGAANIESRWMDEHMQLLRGMTISVKHCMFDANLKDLTFFTAKHNSYATREAMDTLVSRYGLLGNQRTLSHANASRQAAARRWVKERLYNRLPFWLGPPLYFLWRYVFQLGFLDGPQGLIYHFLQGFWYRFLVGAKVWEFDRTLKPLPDREARLAELARLTGYDLAALKDEAEAPPTRD
jgi:glycosyltransferase involved in cell wall biosynthesis